MLKGMWALAGAIGVASGMISIVLLVKEALDIGFVAPMQAILDWYRAAVDLLFSPITPLVEQGVQWLARYFSSIRLSPDWEHLLVIGFVMFGAAARSGVPTDVLTVAGASLMMCIGAAFFGSRALESDLVQFATALLAVLVLSLAAKAAWSAFRRTDDLRLTDLLVYLRRLGVVVGGAALFVVLNAGLKLGGL